MASDPRVEESGPERESTTELSHIPNFVRCNATTASDRTGQLHVCRTLASEEVAGGVRRVVRQPRRRVTGPSLASRHGSTCTNAPSRCGRTPAAGLARRTVLLTPSQSVPCGRCSGRAPVSAGAEQIDEFGRWSDSLMRPHARAAAPRRHISSEEISPSGQRVRGPLHETARRVVLQVRRSRQASNV